MKRTLLAVLAVGCLAVVAAPALSAQGLRLGAGAGLLMPMGDYGDIDKMGFTGGVGGTVTMPGGLGIRVDVSYGTTSEKSGVAAHTTKIMGGMASLVYALGGAAGARPYVMGGLGMYNVKIESGGLSADETKVAFGVGGGVSFPMGTGGSRLFAETRFTSVSTSGASVTFLPIVVGISFGM
jgi:opacity protein-like surface antigen